MESKSVAELKKICKDNGYSGYSKLKKNELIELIKKHKKGSKEKVKASPKAKSKASPKAKSKASPKAKTKAKSSSKSPNLKGKTLADLKAMCKEKGIKGYSKLKRDEIEALLKGGHLPEALKKKKALKIIPFEFMLTNPLLSSALKASVKKKYSDDYFEAMKTLFGEKKPYAKLYFMYCEDPKIHKNPVFCSIMWKKYKKYIYYHGFEDTKKWEKLKNAQREKKIQSNIGLMEVSTDPTVFHHQIHLKNKNWTEFAKRWKEDVLKEKKAPEYFEYREA